MKNQVIKTPNGIKITEDIIFDPQEVEVGIINLKPLLGAEMAYDRGNILSIDFPGEYDINGFLITAYVGAGEKMNYLISSTEGKIWLIQSPEILELDEMCDMDIRLFADEAVNKKLDQLEMEGERINISQLWTDS